MKTLIHFVILSCVSASALAQVQTIVHKEEKRRYIVYTPASYSERPQQRFPVVVNYHGGGMRMAEQMLYTQMNKTADRHHFIVVYPQGIKQDWNVGFDMDYAGGTDDIGFTEAMLAKIKQDYRVDSERVYATGLSRGGFFSWRVAAQLPHLFAAVASVGAPMPVPVVKHHSKPGKVGVMLMHGTDDKIVAYGGKAGGYLSATDTVQYWIKSNGIGGAGISTRKINADTRDETEVTHVEHSAGALSVALVTIEGGGHTWAGADAFNVGLPLGKTSRDIDANEVVWQFFNKHRK